MSDTPAPSVALIHLHRAEQLAALKALDKALIEWKYVRQEMVSVPPEGPKALVKPVDRGVGHATYLVGPRRGQWLTIIQAFERRDDAPFLADVSNRLSEQLQTHALAMLLQENTVLFYNLDYRGTPRDGYTSNPQFLAEKKLTDAEAAQQRHQPKAFTPLMPKENKIGQLFDLLNTGWWSAYDAKQLDERGEILEEESHLDEEERLTHLGQLLQLNGKSGYPFAHWRDTRLIDWTHFKTVYYQARGRTLAMV